MVTLVCLLVCAAPPADPGLAAAATDGLSRAADCLDRGDRTGAAAHLAAHVRAHPDQVMVRAYLAELLFQLKQYDAAAGEFDQFIADAQPMTGPPHKHLVHCHTRLMAIAETGGDAFAENLHRGIGMWLLVKEWDADPARRDEGMSAGTLKQAADALREAKADRPTDPRANLYLAEVYLRLGQSGPARAAVRAARAGLPWLLTPAEAERLAGME
jgi:thioredoxin-like negative regulator of GroEL